jgi:D-arabinose 1-dehydrogenase-like Zn-dependent alcohol dehydrogenase
MGFEFEVFKGSQDGSIVKATSYRELEKNEALVKLTHSGVCGTDEHYLHANMVLGHEGVGIVEQIGSDVTTVKVGDRVGCGWVRQICGTCEQCLIGGSLTTANCRK